MKKTSKNDLGVEGKHGKYPLTAFLEESALQDIVTSLHKYMSTGPASKRAKKKERTLGGQKPSRPSIPSYSDPDSLYEDMHMLFSGVYLCKFRSTVAHKKQNEVTHKKQKGAVYQFRKEQAIYIYDVGLDSDKRVGFLLKNPLDTIITFGNKLDHSSLSDIDTSILNKFDAYWRNRGSQTLSGKPGEPTTLKDELIKDRKRENHPVDAHETLCDLNLRFILNEKGGLDTLQIYGPGIEIFFSKRLVNPVFKNSQGKYKYTGNRLKAKLGDRVITITRGFPPRLSKPLIFDDSIAQIGRLNQLAKLKKVNLGGTFQEPKLIFTEVELLTG